MARKGKYTDREQDVIDKYKKENQKLKEQISKLRKQISRIDLDRYSNIRELIDQYEATEKADENQTGKDQIKAEKDPIKELWDCFHCGSDYLRMVTFERRDGVFYYRKCNTCNHKTKLKRLTKDTKIGPTE